MQGPRMRGEVCRRTDDGAANVGPDPNGDHVRLQAFADPHAGVEAALHHVGEPVLDDHVEHDLGIGFGEGAEA